MYASKELERYGKYNETERLYRGELKTIAQTMVEAVNLQKGQTVILWYEVGQGIPLVHQVYKKCFGVGANIIPLRSDLIHDASRLAGMPLEQIPFFFAKEKAVIAKADSMIIVRGSDDQTVLTRVSKEKQEAYTKALVEAHAPRFDGRINWTLLCYPTPQEAAIDGVNYDDYVQEFLAACNRPWKEVSASQEKLIQKLDVGEELTIMSNMDDPDPRKRTNLTMSIKGMTFCDSTIGRNNPGSEVFSAPLKESVTGQLYGKGPYMYGGHVMEGVFLRFEKGKIVEAHAEKGAEGLQSILANGEGARYLGEIAFGTNPALTREADYANGLLNEKRAGTFHVAIGECYTYIEYNGKQVNVNNGNTDTTVHWDLTVSLKRRGLVLLDGEILSINGRFVDEELAILNPTA